MSDANFAIPYISISETALRVEPHVRVRLHEDLPIGDTTLPWLQFITNFSKRFLQGFRA